MPFKSEKQRKWMWANDPKMAKKWEKEEKNMKETKVRKLIRKMVREIMREGGPGSGPQGGDEDNPFDREPSDDELKDIEKQFESFGGAFKKKDRQKFNKMREEQSEVLGYKLVGKKDVKTEIGDATIKEAVSGADRKILFILVREIVRNLKSKIKNMDVNNKSHLNRVGSSILGIIRAMSYSPDNANYKQYKKYFPKGFNSKLIQKKLKQFHSQTDKVQVTLVTQAIKNELGEGVKEGKLTEMNEPWFEITYKDSRGRKKTDSMRAKNPKEAKKDFVNLMKGRGFKVLKVVKEGKLNEISSSEAKTLLKQLGGNRFMAMTGAKDFGIGKDGLHFKIGRNAKSISHVVINLSSMDLYDIKFLRVRAGKIKVVKKLKGVYADQLGTMFKKYTGMNVRL